MVRFDSAFSRAFVVGVGLGLLSLQGLVRGQIAAHEEFDRGSGMARDDGAIDEVTTPEVAATAIVGRVIGPDGAPAVGAVVVSSAGGQTVTDAKGEFSVEVGLAAGAESVRVTAVMGSGTGSLVASAQIGGLALWATTSAGTLILEQAATCQPSWLPTIGQAPGTDNYLNALAVFDDGSGPALYAVGAFSTAGGVSAHYIAKWDGSSWSALGSGMDGSVYALTTLDDGSGPALYAGGVFHTAGGVSAHYIAKWDGSSWSALGSGTNGTVDALTVFDDGSGPAVYAGGYFTTAGGVAANRIAKWNGTSWSTLGSGMASSLVGEPFVDVLAIFNDGSGPALYAGGFFTTAGGRPANFVAKWNGSSWSALGRGMNNQVRALTVFDDGSGPALYVGGSFGTAGGVVAYSIAKWDGTSWSALGSGMAGGVTGTSVDALTVFDDGSGPVLVAGGNFTIAGGVAANEIAKWNGSTWSALGSGMSGMSGLLTSVGALAVFDDGSGPVLYAGGSFDSAGGVTAIGIAKWEGTSWSALSSGMNNTVFALTVFDDGSGPALYAGGAFTTAGGVALDYIAKWDGATWSALGSGMNPFGNVFALAVYDDGSGPALYAGGDFTTAGDVAASRIARWDGASWSALGSGVDGPLRALAVFDDGSGPALFAGGSFTTAGGVAANRIAKWNGTSWSALGSGMAGGVFGAPAVYVVEVFDDGSGPALFAGGNFATAGGTPANCIAKWDGTNWSALGSGMNDWVQDLSEFDDGSGPALYAGGLFGTAGGVEAHSIAKWDGMSWSALSGGSNEWMFALSVFDDGSGPALYAGGAFATASGEPLKGIAKWDGSSWSAVGSGLTGTLEVLTVFDDGSGPALYAGGSGSAIDSLDSYLAKWGGCSPPPSPWTNLGSGLAGISGIPQLNGIGELLAGTPGAIRLIDAAPSAPAALFISGSNTPTPFKGGTLLTVPVLLTLAVPTDSLGNVLLPWTAWPSGLSGVSLFFQFGIQDTAAVKGVSLSNALMGVSP